jgi:hypothetical protein
MRRAVAGFVIALCLGIAGLVRAGNGTEVVTNPTPAVSATMTLTGSSESCYFWTVSGKVKPAYRGHGASVSLVCQPYNGFGNGGGGVVFGGTRSCDGDYCVSNVDACGNFSFPATVCGASPQFSPDNVCTFIVHVDDSKAPQACSQKPPPIDGPPQDPNGSAPCSGGLCPNSP